MQELVDRSRGDAEDARGFGVCQQLALQGTPYRIEEPGAEPGPPDDVVAGTGLVRIPRLPRALSLNPPAVGEDAEQMRRYFVGDPPVHEETVCHHALANVPGPGDVARQGQCEIEIKADGRGR